MAENPGLMEEEDNRLVAQILATSSSDNFLSWRFRTIAKMNPYMASSPETIMSMASMPVSNQELFTNAGAIYGMQQANELATKLPSYQPSTQRAIYSQLTPAQQNSLRAMGYELPDADIHSPGMMSDLFGIALTPLRIGAQGLGRLAGPIVKPTLDFAIDAANVPFAAYRTLTQLDTAEKWIAAAGGVAALAAGVAFLPVTAGASGTLAAAGIAGLSALGGATAASFAASTLINGSPTRWINAWNDAWDGERLFTQSATKQAKQLLENPDLVSLAQELASDIDSDEDLLDLARDIAGVRDAQRTDVQNNQLIKLAARYGDEGTPEFSQAFQTLKDLFLQPAFKEAVSILANGKISIGRDITRALNSLPIIDLDPSEGVGRWISGGIDAASMFFLDPLLFAGGLANKYKVAKYGLNFEDAGVAARFREIAALPKVARKMDLVADAVRTGRVELLDRGASEYKALYLDLRAHADNLAALDGPARGFTGKDVVEYIAGSTNMKSIMSGIGIVHGTNKAVIKGIGVSQYYLRQASNTTRAFLEGLDDIRLESNLKKLFDDPELGPALIDHLHGVSDDVVRELTPLVGDENVARAIARMHMGKPVQEIFETGVDNLDYRRLFGRSIDDGNEVISRLASDDALAYSIGRVIGSIPIIRTPLRGVAGFVKGVTTRVPGGAIAFDGAGAVEDIGKLVDLFQNMAPSYVRTSWKRAIVNAPSSGARMQGSIALIDSLASAAGMRLTDEGSQLLDEFVYKYAQIYGQGPTSRISTYFDPELQLAAGTLPVSHMAKMLPIPNLDEIRKATRQGKIMEFLIGKNPHILAMQNRYWKPAVLLRLGFIFRNAGEEMLGFATRYGFGSLMQEFTARGLAQKNLAAKVRTEALNREALDDALRNVDNVQPSARTTVTELDRWIQRSRWDLPAVARPVARAIDTLGKSGRPYVQVINRYAEWLSDIFIRRANSVRTQMQTGYGNYAGLKKYLDYVEGSGDAFATGALDLQTARANIQNWWRQLAFGNERSLRRMIVGGVDPKLVRHAEQFEGVFLKSIMEQVGTSNQAPWQRLRRGKNIVQASVSTARGEDLIFVQDLGVRELATINDPGNLRQPYTAGVQSVRQEMLDDPIAAAALQEFGMILNPEIAATLPAPVAQRVLVTFDNLLEQLNGGIDKEFFQLYLTLTNGRFDRNRFEAILATMKRQANDIIETYPGETRLIALAQARNEFIDALRATFPAGDVPKWSDLVKLANDEKKNPLLTAKYKKFLDLADIPADDPEQFMLVTGFRGLRDQINTYEQIERLLGSDLSVDSRNWINRLLMTHFDQPGAINMQAVRDWDPRLGNLGSPFYESFEQAEPAIRERARQTYIEMAESSEFKDTLNLNARWASDVDSVPLYVIEPRAIADELDDLDPLWRVSSMGPGNELHQRLIRYFDATGVDPQTAQRLAENIRLSLAYNRPLIFNDADAAYDALAFLSRSAPESTVKRGFITRPPGGARAVTGEESARLLGRQLGMPESTFEFQNASSTLRRQPGDPRPDLGILSYQPEDVSEIALKSFHVEPITDEPVNLRVDEIIDSLVNHIRQNVLAGRRSVFYVRNDRAARPLYRQVGTRAEQVEPGEIISAKEVFFSSPDANPDSIVRVGDQRYFFTDTPRFEGNNEILWGIMNPIMFDHAEANKGMMLFSAKSPLSPSGGLANPADADYVRLRYSAVDDVTRTPANLLPDYETLQVYSPVVENFWDKIVQFGFGRVIGPWIDAIARKPTAFHAFALAADRNTANIQWLIRNSPRQRNLRFLADRLVSNNVIEGPAGQFVELYGELGRLIGKAHNDINASTWSNLEAIGYLRGTLADEPTVLNDLILNWSERGTAYAREVGKLSKVSNTTLFAAAQDLIGNTARLNMQLTTGSTDEILSFVDRVFGPESALEGAARGFSPNARRLPKADMTDEQWELDQALKTVYELPNGQKKSGWSVLKEAAEQRKNVDADVYKYAAEHAVRDLMPFIDSHEIRSQFADSVSGLLPFWYAEENFLKRWAKMFAEGGPAASLARIRKLQMTYLGLRTMGVVRQDPRGKDYFVWPGSEYLNEALQRVFGTELPLNTVFQSPTDRIVPGFQPAFGAPQTGPFVSIPIDFVASIFPEVVPAERVVLGDFSAFRSTLDHIVPAQIKNTWAAISAFSDEGITGSNEREASAMMSAMQQLEFTEYALRDDATPGEKDEYIRRLRDHARVILLSQAIGGWFMPAQLSPLTTANASSLSWLTEGQIENPVDIFAPQYYELISALGIEEGTIAFLELNQDANLKNVTSALAATVSRTTTPSGAALPTTEEGIAFYVNNRELLDQFPEAGPWLLPQDPARESKRSQYAYDTEIVTGLRDRRTPEEFYNAMKYKEGAAVYFDSRRRYEEEYLRLKNSGQDGLATVLTNNWNEWSTIWKLTHPVFAEGLVSSTARQRRTRILDQIRILLKDPAAPRASHFDALKVLMDTFDAFMIARGYLALDGTGAGQLKLNGAKLQFKNWAAKFTAANPEVLSFYQTVISPEAGVD